MPNITYDRFEIGLDRRKGASVSDANRLRELKNAYITAGKVIKKRPGAPLVATLEAGTIGLHGANGKLNTFYPYNATPIVHANTLFQANQLIHTASTAYGQPLSKIHYADVFSGYLYVAAEYSDGAIFHYYINAANPNKVADANCPNTKSCLKMYDRMFAIDPANNDVKHSALNDPLTWTAPGVTPAIEAGNLLTGTNARGSSEPTSLGLYQGQLASFMVDSMQLWNISTDATQMGIDRTIEGIGTLFPGSVLQFAGDIVFLSQAGYRSITQQYNNNNLNDSDIGSPIDSIVRPLINDSIETKAAYFTANGQLWQIVNDATTSKVFVYSFSRTAKISAWSEYEFDFRIDDATTLNGHVYLRSGDNVYTVDETDLVFTDNGVAYEMLIELPFLDFKNPGILKHVTGMDLVVDGEIDIAFRYDPNDTTKITDPITISGDTRQRQMIPIEITTTMLAPVITSSASNDVQIDLLTFYFENLGPF